jgi:hypothetical protein
MTGGQIHAAECIGQLDLLVSRVADAENGAFPQGGKPMKSEEDGEAGDPLGQQGLPS